MKKEKMGICKRIAVFVLSAVMAVCVLAQPAFAVTADLISPNTTASSTDAEKHKHTYGEWQTVKEAGTFAELGLKERTCTECDHVQKLYIPSPLLGIVFAILALICIIGFVNLFAFLAKKFKKFFRIFLVILVALCLAILLIGAGAQSILVGGKFGKNLVLGLVELLGFKGFTASRASDCIFMMFGSIACKVINGLFYVSLITIIFAIIAIIKAAITGVKKAGKAAGKAVSDTYNETKDKLFGGKDD